MWHFTVTRKTESRRRSRSLPGLDTVADTVTDFYLSPYPGCESAPAFNRLQLLANHFCSLVLTQTLGDKRHVLRLTKCLTPNENSLKKKLNKKKKQTRRWLDNTGESSFNSQLWRQETDTDTKVLRATITWTKYSRSWDNATLNLKKGEG